MTADDIERGILAAREESSRTTLRQLQREREEQALRIASGRLPFAAHPAYPNLSAEQVEEVRARFFADVERTDAQRDAWERIWKRDMSALVAAGGSPLDGTIALGKDDPPPTRRTRSGPARGRLGLTDDYDNRPPIELDLERVTAAAIQHELLSEDFE